ncbi:MAG: tetratricopeptide repeat protein [Gammaproteobacteria bacterium]|nr:tetratricopeptide repeat protein [Gammaproteobacteria bacterium]
MRPGVWLGALLCIASWQFAFAEEAPSDADTSSPDPADAEMYGPTTRNDTLWSIARAVRPPDMTLAETVSALQRMNPDAFVEGDPNVLMRGVMLQVPTSVAAAEPPTDPVEPEPAPSTVEPPEEVSFRDVVPLPADPAMDPENLAMRNAELEDRLETVQVELDVATDKIQALESQITTMRRRLTESQEREAAPQSGAPRDVAKIPTNVIMGVVLAVLLVGAVLIVFARSRRASRVDSGEPPQRPLGARRVGAGRPAPEPERDADPDPDEIGPETKLNLARALLDLGRTDQAREVLREVMTEGSDDESREAAQLLQQLE